MDVLDTNYNTNELVLTKQMKGFLSEVAKWAKIISICGFIMVGLIVIMGLGMGTFMGSAMSGLDNTAAGMTTMSTGFMVAYFLLLLPSIFFQFYIYIVLLPK